MSRQRVQRLSDWEDARYSVVPPRASRDAQLSWTHGRLLIELGRVNTKQGWCELSQKALAGVLGIARQTLNIAMAELVEWGYVQKRSQQQTGTAFCLYRVLMDCPVKQSGVSPVDDTPQVSAADDTRVTPEVTPVSGASTDTHLDQRSEIKKEPPKPPKGGDDQSSISIDEQFAEFYAAYPRKAGRIEALHAWTLIVTGKKHPKDRKRRKPKAVERATVAELLAGARRYAASVKGNELKYIPHAATWLNAGRWLDEPEGKKVATVSAGGITLLRSEHPEAFEAWLARTNSQTLKDLWTKNGVAMVPSQYPPGMGSPLPAQEHA